MVAGAFADLAKKITPHGIDKRYTTWCNLLMELITHLRTLSVQDRAELADRSNTSVGHLQNVSYGYRPCAPELAVLIESNTGQAVTRKDLRPNDWQAIWPELVDAEDLAETGKGS